MGRRVCFLTVHLLLLSYLFFPDAVSAGKYQGNRRRGSLPVIDDGVRGTRRAKEPVVIVLPAPLGPKKLIAVAEFENKSNWAGQVNLGSGMADQLITALITTGRFIVLERQSIEAVLNEQNLAASSRAVQEGGAKTGEITRAQIFIQGAVTEFEQNTSSGAGGFSYGGMTVTSSEATAHVAVDVRVYDTTTGQILASKSCKGTAKASGGSVGFSGGDFGIAGGGQAKTPLDFAVRDAITQAVGFIVLELQKIPWEGRIAVVKDQDVYMNCGRTGGILEGDQFSVFKPGEPITDPETGLNLGSENTLIGKIEVVKVDEKFSKAIPVCGEGFERSDILRYEGPKPPPPPPVAVPSDVIIRK